MKELARAQ